MTADIHAPRFARGIFFCLNTGGMVVLFTNGDSSKKPAAKEAASAGDA